MRMDSFRRSGGEGMADRYHYSRRHRDVQRRNHRCSARPPRAVPMTISALRNLCASPTGTDPQHVTEKCNATNISQEIVMNRILRIAGAQMGPTQRADTREHTLARMISLFEQAASKKVDLVVFPELAFTTFFPRWLLSGPELDSYFEMDMPNPSVQPLFDCARRLHTGFYVG